MDWESGEEVGIWVKEKLEVRDLVSDWTPYFHNWEKEGVEDMKVHKRRKGY